LPPDDFSGNWVERFFLNRLDPQAHPYFSTIAGLQVSAHFLIRRDGQAIQFVGCDRRAWHAGQSIWQGRENCNDYSVGIELEGSDSQPFTAVQYAALWRLIDALRARYPLRAIAGHCHVAPGRKSDPGPYFDWAALRRRYPVLGPAPEVAG
jgi:AmpD protein